MHSPDPLPAKAEMASLKGAYLAVPQGDAFDPKATLFTRKVTLFTRKATVSRPKVTVLAFSTRTLSTPSTPPADPCH
jgi:hypothetical protein